ncbi:MAG: hypothetical protein ABW080_15230 [Candidatus Thiodiazotropha sp.]
MDTQPFISIATLRDTAQLYGGSLLGSEMHQSYPLPLRAKQSIYLRFLYSYAEIIEAGEGLKLWSPRYVVSVEASSGKLEDVQIVTPESFGLNDPPDQPIGSYLSRAERLSDSAFLTSEIKLLQLYDYLLPLYASNISSSDLKVKNSIIEFSEYFKKVIEQPLLPYYRVMAKEFLLWLGISS